MGSNCHPFTTIQYNLSYCQDLVSCTNEGESRDVAGIGKDCPQLSSFRVVYMTTYLTAVILLGAYSGTLVSFLAVRSASLPFTDLEDVVQAGTHKLGALNTSTMLSYFSSARSGLYQRVYSSLLHESHGSLVGDIRSGLLRVCSEQFLLMAMDTEVVVHLDSLPCQVAALPARYFKSSLSIGLTLRSHYKIFLNYQ